MKDKPNKLDDVIREKMSELGAPYRPETWDWLSERLDALDTPVEVDPLDGIIRNKLQHLETPYRPETWDWLSEHLDEIDEGSPAGAELQAMDEAIYERMHRLEKPYDPNHWPMLLKKLEGNAYVGRQVIRYKAMELSLLVLLFITFVRLPLPTGKDLKQPLVPPRPQAMETPIAPGDQQQHNTPASSLSAAQSEPLSSDIAGNHVAPAALPLTVPAASDQQVVSATWKETEDLDGLLPAQPIGDRTSLRDLSQLQLPSEIKSLGIPEKKLATEHIAGHVSAIIRPEYPILGINGKAMLGVMTFLPTGFPNPLCLTCPDKLDQEALLVKPPTFFRIGMQGGPDYNRVITPSTTIGGDEYSADRYSLGYSGGITFGLETGRWEIETGLIYSNKRYYALPVLVLDGSVEDGFFGDGTKQFDLDVFQVPLNFRYNFIRKNRWRVYAMAGMSLHVTTLSNYYLAEADGFITERFRPQPIRPGQDGHGRNAPSIKSEFDNFAKGWLEGGTFGENSFLTGNAAFGIERFITDYWSIYAQPTYSHSLLYLNDGLGPYYDRIHTNSLIFGVKVRLR